ncbi:hypothetical protein AMECASPLE_005407 [Ameca splendens]|uniref:Uncharacterized protein n=1 Tax=Ameca splendens TaxID=208324 RepID=A0ABV1A7Z5_9TELE
MAPWELDVNKTHEWRACCQQVDEQSRGRQANIIGCGGNDECWTEHSKARSLLLLVDVILAFYPFPALPSHLEVVATQCSIFTFITCHNHKQYWLAVFFVLNMNIL